MFRPSAVARRLPNSSSVLTRFQSTTAAAVPKNKKVYQIDQALKDGDSKKALEIFKNELEFNPNLVSQLEKRGLHLKLFRAALKDKSSSKDAATIDPKELFQKYIKSGATVGWIASAVILNDVLENNPSQGLQAWVEYLENLDNIALIKTPGNKEAAWSALIAYVANCIKEQQPVNSEIALKLVPIKDIPLGRQVMDLLEFRKLNQSFRKEILEGLTKIRLDNLDVSSLEFIASLPTDRPLELETKYKEALKKVAETNGSLPESVYARFIACFAECTRVNDAFQVWNHMVAHNVEPTILSWNSLLKAGALSRENKDEVFGKLWGEMVESGIKPNSDSFVTLIEFCFRTGKPEKALEILDRIQEGKEEGITVTLKMFNSVLDGLLRLNKIDEAEGLLKEGLTQGYSPNVITYNYFIRSYINTEQFDKANKIVDQMIKSKVRPDVSTYTNVIDSVFKLSRKQNLNPDEQVSSLLNEMTKYGIKLNAVTITAIISGLTRSSNDIESSRTLFNIMVSKKINPNARTIATVIDNELKYGDYQHALQYFHALPSYGIPQGTPVYNQLIHWASYNNRVEDAYKLFKLLVKNTRTNPNKFTYAFILNGCYQQQGGSNKINSIAIASDVLKTLSKQLDDSSYFDMGTELPKLIPKIASSVSMQIPANITEALSTKQ